MEIRIRVVAHKTVGEDRKGQAGSVHFQNDKKVDYNQNVWI